MLNDLREFQNKITNALTIKLLNRFENSNLIILNDYVFIINRSHVKYSSDLLLKNILPIYLINTCFIMPKLKHFNE